MHINVLLFAHLRDRAGTRQIDLNLPAGATVLELKKQLGEEHPSLAEALPTVLVSINRDFAFPEDEVHQGDEVALFPPVSGGAPFPTVFRITEDPLDLNEVVDAIRLPTSGAVCVFTGLVRAITKRGQAHETERLEYEAYPPMAESKMEQVADEIRKRWPAVEGIAIVQRVGTLDPGTPTVMIACGAAHRDTGVFEAARYGIDRLKQIVPIWKKEIGPEGEMWVEGHYSPDEQDRQDLA